MVAGNNQKRESYFYACAPVETLGRWRILATEHEGTAQQHKTGHANACYLSEEMQESRCHRSCFSGDDDMGKDSVDVIIDDKQAESNPCTRCVPV